MKVLLYGNCQLGALAQQLRLSPRYTVLDCRDFDFVPFWLDPGLFAVWSNENYANRQHLSLKVVEAARLCDVFIFQHYHAHHDRPQAITTEYLCTQATQALQICLPSFWYDGYQIDDINAVLLHLYRSGKNEAQILEFLQHKTAAFVEPIFQERHQHSIEELQRRHENEKNIYTHFVPCFDWIKQNYARQLVAYSHSHPSIHYYNYVLDAFQSLGLDDIPKFSDTSVVPAAPHFAFQCDELFYFRQLFPNMEDLTLHHKFFRAGVNEAAVAKQLSLICELDNQV